MPLPVTFKRVKSINLVQDLAEPENLSYFQLSNLPNGFLGIQRDKAFSKGSSKEIRSGYIHSLREDKMVCSKALELLYTS